MLAAGARVRAVVSGRAVAQQAAAAARCVRGRRGVMTLPAAHVVVSAEVAAALAEARPVVALESTIISHGMPYPDNLAMATDVEAIVRSHGATPATIAIVDGTIHVGTDAVALERLAKTGAAARKCTTRDIADVVAARGTGATTVAATMAVAAGAGIRTFVTGGIGGVHRGVEATWDVSADLLELGRTPVAVVCAGVKSILDIGKTLEVLETNGVPVITYTGGAALPPRAAVDFPAFFSPHSGIPSPAATGDLAALARSIHLSHVFGLRHGHVIAVPNPAPADGEVVERAIQQALAEALERKVTGRDTTPFLLKRINELTGGQSLTANLALVKNNAVVGSRLAVEIAKVAAAAAVDGSSAVPHVLPLAAPRANGGTITLVPATKPPPPPRPAAPAATKPTPAAAAGAPPTPATAAAPAAAAPPAPLPSPPPPTKGAATPATKAPAHDKPQTPSPAPPAAPKAAAPKAAVPKAAAPKAAVPPAASPKAAVPPATSSKAAAPKAAVPPATSPKAAAPKAAVPPATSPKTAPAPNAPPKAPKAAQAATAPAAARKAHVPAAKAPAGAGGAASGGGAGLAPPPARAARDHGASRGGAAATAAAASAAAAATDAAMVAGWGAADTFGMGGGSKAQFVAGLVGRGGGSRGMHTAAWLRSAGSPLAPAAHARQPVVLGGAVMDLLCRPAAGTKLLRGTSNPGTVTQSYGGVGRNVAESMARMGAPPVLCTALGRDAAAAGLVAYCESTLGMTVLTPRTPGGGGASRTAVYSAMLDERGELVAAVADMDAFASLTPEALAALGGGGAAPATPFAALLPASPLLVIDANVPAATTGAALVAAARAPGGAVPAVFECTSVAKCVRLADSGAMHLAAAVKPNRYEVLELAHAVRRAMGLPDAVEEVAASGAVQAATTTTAGAAGAGAGAADSGMALTQTVELRTPAAGAGGEWAAIAAQLGGAPAGGDTSRVTVRNPATGAATTLEAVTSPVAAGDAAAADAAAAGGGADDADGESGLDYAVLTAAQTVLAALIRPSGFATPFSPAVAAAGGVTASSVASQPGAAAHAGVRGGVFEGRKHVWVTLGKTGVLWLSAPPARSDAVADLLAAMPFFAAAAHADIGMDFKLCPAPPAAAVKVTGAGDTLLGAVCAELSRGAPVARALQVGLAAAKIAVESEPGASTIPPRLSAAAAHAVAHADVAPVDADYA